jgi:hypothetical protein
VAAYLREIRSIHVCRSPEASSVQAVSSSATLSVLRTIFDLGLSTFFVDAGLDVAAADCCGLEDDGDICAKAIDDTPVKMTPASAAEVRICLIMMDSSEGHRSRAAVRHLVTRHCGTSIGEDAQYGTGIQRLSGVIGLKPDEMTEKALSSARWRG